MAISVSAVANRSALRSDYYTGKKITVTPLNFVCMRRRRPPRLPRAAPAHATTRRKDLCSRALPQDFSHRAEMPMKYGFSSRRHFPICGDDARSHAARRRFCSRLDGRGGARRRDEKNCALNGFAASFAAPRRRKTHESVPTDSRRGRRIERARASHARRATEFRLGIPASARAVSAFARDEVAAQHAAISRATSCSGVR
jgi:hypothetical protein